MLEISIPHSIKSAKSGDLVKFIDFYPIRQETGVPIVCTNNLSYILENNFDEIRVKRSSDRINSNNTIGQDKFESLANRTFFINCSMPDVVCETIICRAGPFENTGVAKVEIEMMGNFDLITGNFFLC